MRALQYKSYGGPEVLEVAEAPEPHAGPGQIRIAVKAASLNPFDWKLRSGMMAGGKPLEEPAYLGLDASGVVDEVGEGVTGVAVGDDVFGRGRNTQAEFAVLDSWAPKAPQIDWAVAGAAGTAGETSERVLRLLDLKPGDTLFIDGGAGGVGSVTAQFAVARGLRVIASAGQDNQDYLREIGVTPVLYGQGLVNRVRAVPGEPVDAVFDAVGKTPIEDLIALAPEPHQVLSIANFGAANAGARVTGGSEDSQPMKALAETAELLEQNKLVVKVQTFPLDRAVEAYRISESGHVRGKLVLLP
ncbi:MAG TPA: NADP-dependent oxidoreductase [Propionibacteriaceae bacterium]|jgi:NADPH:quinone reductase-like Zn-dependent oxidoreductase|nr:NADP-dependent oxidoreductase [Propionibacteriaceae bacterium]